MKTKKLIPDPDKKIAVLRRYLHIIALLQNNKDPMDWNGTSLCEMLQHEEHLFNNIMTDKNIRDYININIKGELGLDIELERGSRRIELKDIPKDMLEPLLNVYSTFVVTDSSKNQILKNFIKKHPYDCFWMLGRIYFASLSRNSIQFDYVTNTGHKMNKCRFNPYYILFRNNNLYLFGRQTEQTGTWLIILNRITNLKVLESKFEDQVPAVEETFKDSLGSFIGKKYNITIEFAKEIENQIEQFLSILEPKITAVNGGEKFIAEFKISDTAYLCKQLFLYGKNVRIIKPKEVKDMMVEMLKESMGVYKI